MRGGRKGRREKGEEGENREGRKGREKEAEKGGVGRKGRSREKRKGREKAKGRQEKGEGRRGRRWGNTVGKVGESDLFLNKERISLHNYALHQCQSGIFWSIFYMLQMLSSLHPPRHHDHRQVQGCRQTSPHLSYQKVSHFFSAHPHST